MRNPWLTALKRTEKTCSQTKPLLEIRREKSRAGETSEIFVENYFLQRKLELSENFLELNKPTQRKSC